MKEARWARVAFSVMMFVSGTPEASGLSLTTTTGESVSVDQMVDACSKAANVRADPICSAAVEVHDFGTVTLEALQAKLQLSPWQWTILSAAHAASQGRLRLQSGGYFRNSRQALELNRDGQVWVSLEKTL